MSAPMGVFLSCGVFIDWEIFICNYSGKISVRFSLSTLTFLICKFCEIIGETKEPLLPLYLLIPKNLLSNLTNNRFSISLSRKDVNWVEPSLHLYLLNYILYGIEIELEVKLNSGMHWHQPRVKWTQLEWVHVLFQLRFFGCEN